MPRLGEKCGIFGVYGMGLDASRLTFFGLHALQHRGQESSGMVVSDGRDLRVHKAAGLVPQVFDEGTITHLFGHISIGHNRYSTSAGSDVSHAQPILASSNSIALAHNGNLPSVRALQDFLQNQGVDPAGQSDSELMAMAIGCLVDQGATLAEAVEKTFPLMTGVFSLVVMDKTTLVAVRDEYGVRPLSLARLNGGYVVASETCACDAVGAKVERDIAPGEMVVIDAQGVHSHQLAQPNQKLDIFEFVYFARPDSVMLGKSVYGVRRECGIQLAYENRVDADIVIPVPETAIPVAIGYSQTSGIPLEMGLIKNRYVHRTFIQPEQHIRDLGVRMKLNPLPGVLGGKRVAVIDDSIVRGTTSRQIVRALFEAGAREVHFLVSCPPVRFPDFYGIDTPDQRKLIGFRHTVEQIRDYLGATSLTFLSYEGLIKATGLPEESFCTSVFTGKYPVPLHEREHDVESVEGWDGLSCVLKMKGAEFSI